MMMCRNNKRIKIQINKDERKKERKKKGETTYLAFPFSGIQIGAGGGYP